MAEDDFFEAFHAFLRFYCEQCRSRFFLRVGLLIIIAFANPISKKESINSSVAIIYKVDERREV